MPSRAEAPPLPTRRRTAVIDAHSARVRLLRRSLPWLIGLLLLLPLGWIAWKAALAELSPLSAPVNSIHMLNPKFYGRDSQGRAYTLSAGSAIRDKQHPNEVALDRPVFILQTGAPKPTVLHARQGLFRQDSHKLFLSGEVVLENSEGYRFQSESALIDTDAGSATGETAVTVTGPIGQIASSAYTVYDGGARMVFRGAVRAHFTNSNEQR